MHRGARGIGPLGYHRIEHHVQVTLRDAHLTNSNKLNSHTQLLGLILSRLKDAGFQPVKIHFGCCRAVIHKAAKAHGHLVHLIVLLGIHDLQQLLFCIAQSCLGVRSLRAFHKQAWIIDLPPEIKLHHHTGAALVFAGTGHHLIVPRGFDMNPLIKFVNALNGPRPFGTQAWFLNGLTVLAQCVYKGDLILAHLIGEHVRAKNEQQQPKDNNVDDFFHGRKSRVYFLGGTLISVMPRRMASCKSRSTSSS